MIIHVFVPWEEADSLKDKEGIDFRIIARHSRNMRGESLLIIDTTEEELVFLKLKYGNNNAWKR